MGAHRDVPDGRVVVRFSPGFSDAMAKHSARLDRMGKQLVALGTQIIPRGTLPADQWAEENARAVDAVERLTRALPISDPRMPRALKGLRESFTVDAPLVEIVTQPAPAGAAVAAGEDQQDAVVEALALLVEVQAEQRTMTSQLLEVLADFVDETKRSARSTRRWTALGILIGAVAAGAAVAALL